MEEKIHAAEGKLKAAQSKLEDPWISADAAKLMECHQAVDLATTEVEGLFRRWEELEEKKKQTAG